MKENGARCRDAAVVLPSHTLRALDLFAAAVLPNPHEWRVDPPGPYVRSRAATIHARMAVVRRDGLDACVLGLSGCSLVR